MLFHLGLWILQHRSHWFLLFLSSNPCSISCLLSLSFLFFSSQLSFFFFLFKHFLLFRFLKPLKFFHSFMLFSLFFRFIFSYFLSAFLQWVALPIFVLDVVVAFIAFFCFNCTCFLMDMELRKALKFPAPFTRLGSH